MFINLFQVLGKIMFPPWQVYILYNIYMMYVYSIFVSTGSNTSTKQHQVTTENCQVSGWKKTWNLQRRRLVFWWMSWVLQAAGKSGNPTDFVGGKLWFMEQPSGKLMGRGPFGTCFSMFSSDDMIFFRFPKDLKRWFGGTHRNSNKMSKK